MPLTYTPNPVFIFKCQIVSRRWNGCASLSYTWLYLNICQHEICCDFSVDVLSMLYNPPTEHYHTARCIKHEVSALWDVANKRRVLFFETFPLAEGIWLHIYIFETHLEVEGSTASQLLHMPLCLLFPIFLTFIVRTGKMVNFATSALNSVFQKTQLRYWE